MQNNKNVHLSLKNPKAFFNDIYPIIYPTKTSSIWDGYKAALTYRVSACTMTLGSQPLVQTFLKQKYGNEISQWTGNRYQSTATHMISGAIFGVMETAFLPLDRWKLLRQINNTTPFFDLMKQQRTKLYVGSSITCIRNVKAFSAWFGVSDIVNQHFSHHKQTGPTPFYQRVITSSAGAIVATVISNPADVIKTIKQTQSDRLDGQKPDSSMKIFSQVWKENGIKGLGRGMWPRLGSIVPRLTFLKAVSEELTPVIHNALDDSIKFSRK
ncbi:MAG: hypothetical protein QG556_101 [Pseudomonadota bacterium]|nr:hypothetical protein [Pseudomonadota bacterium]